MNSALAIRGRSKKGFSRARVRRYVETPGALVRFAYCWEDDRDDDQADDDRQRAELAGLDVDPPAPGVRGDRVARRGPSASRGGSVTMLMRRPPDPGSWRACRR